MPEYRRFIVPGATFFFTVVTDSRRRILAEARALDALRAAFREVNQRHPFTIEAIVVLPDHLHCVWTLPPSDSRFSLRWRLIKSRFTSSYLAGGGIETARSHSRRKREERGVWQRRFWEHVIRDERDYDRHMDYIHYNPVRHGLVRCPHAWPYSSFSRAVAHRIYPSDWCCVCKGRQPALPDFSDMEDQVGE